MRPAGLTIPYPEGLTPWQRFRGRMPLPAVVGRAVIRSSHGSRVPPEDIEETVPDIARETAVFAMAGKTAPGIVIRNGRVLDGGNVCPFAVSGSARGKSSLKLEEIGEISGEQGAFSGGLNFTNLPALVLSKNCWTSSQPATMKFPSRPRIRRLLSVVLHRNRTNVAWSPPAASPDASQGMFPSMQGLPCASVLAPRLDDELRSPVLNKAGTPGVIGQRRM